MINTKNTTIKYIKFNGAEDIPNVLSISSPDKFSYEKDNLGSYRMFMVIERPRYKSLYLPIGYYLLKIGSTLVTMNETEFNSL